MKSTDFKLFTLESRFTDDTREEIMGKWKFNSGDIVIANDKAPGDYRDRRATVIERGPGTAEYTLNFDGQIAYLNSWWLNPINEVSTNSSNRLLPNSIRHKEYYETGTTNS